MNPGGLPGVRVGWKIEIIALDGGGGEEGRALTYALWRSGLLVALGWHDGEQPSNRCWTDSENARKSEWIYGKNTYRRGCTDREPEGDMRRKLD